MLFRRQGALWMPEANGVGAMSAAFGAATVSANLAPVGPYPAIVTVGTALGGGVTSAQFMMVSQEYRIRQTGTVYELAMCIGEKPAPSTVKVQYWRQVTVNNYTLIAESEDIMPGLTVGVTKIVKLANPIAGVQSGDFWGWRTTGNDSAVGIGICTTGLGAGIDCYFEFNAAAWPSGVNPIAKGHLAGTGLTIESYMRAPDIVFIGDSLTQGLAVNSSFIQVATAVTDLANYWGTLVAATHSNTFQNMGHGSDTMVQINARLNADAIALKPKRIVLEGGINDIVVSGSTAAATIVQYQTALAAIRAANITPYVVGILPDSNTTAPQATAVDTVNAFLAANVAATYGGVWLGGLVTAAMGVNRGGGPPGNLWNLNPAFDSGDGVHLNIAGEHALAGAINTIF